MSIPPKTAKILLALPVEVDATLERLITEGIIQNKSEYIRTLILRDFERIGEYDALVPLTPGYDRYDTPAIERHIKRLSQISEPDKVQRRTLRVLKGALNNIQNKGTLTAPQRKAVFSYRLQGFRGSDESTS